MNPYKDWINVWFLLPPWFMPWRRRRLMVGPIPRAYRRWGYRRSAHHWGSEFSLWYFYVGFDKPRKT